VPETRKEASWSATASRASSRRKTRSLRHSLASSTAARRRLPRCSSRRASNRSKSVKASAAVPANLPAPVQGRAAPCACASRSSRRDSPARPRPSRPVQGAGQGATVVAETSRRPSRLRARMGRVVLRAVRAHGCSAGVASRAPQGSDQAKIRAGIRRWVAKVWRAWGVTRPASAARARAGQSRRLHRGAPPGVSEARPGRPPRAGYVRSASTALVRVDDALHALAEDRRCPRGGPRPPSSPAARHAPTGVEHLQDRRSRRSARRRGCRTTPRSGRSEVREAAGKARVTLAGGLPARARAGSGSGRSSEDREAARDRRARVPGRRVARYPRTTRAPRRERAHFGAREAETVEEIGPVAGSVRRGSRSAARYRRTQPPPATLHAAGRLHALLGLAPVVATRASTRQALPRPTPLSNVAPLLHG
jgi:hypothetical protein